MTKSKMQFIARKYGMQIRRDEDTGNAWGISVLSKEEIPELDDIIAEESVSDSCVTGWALDEDGKIRYTIVCPSAWFSADGWK